MTGRSAGKVNSRWDSFGEVVSKVAECTTKSIVKEIHRASHSLSRPQATCRLLPFHSVYSPNPCLSQVFSNVLRCTRLSYVVKRIERCFSNLSKPERVSSILLRQSGSIALSSQTSSKTEDSSNIPKDMTVVVCTMITTRYAHEKKNASRTPCTCDSRI